MTILRQVLALFTRRERRQLYWLLPAIVVMALVEVVGIASVIPFLDLLSRPSAIGESALLSWLYARFGFTTNEGFLIFIGAGVLAVLLLSNAFTMLVTWAMLRVAWRRNYTVSRRLLASYLYRPYEFFLNHNTSELAASLFGEVQQVIMHLLLPGMRMIARLVVAVFILAFLFVYDPLLSLITFVLLGSTYAGIFLFVKRRLRRLGHKRVTAQRRAYKLGGEALTGIKDIKLLGKEEAFIKRFSAPAEVYADSTATYQIIGNIPRYALEVIAFGGILAIVIYYLAVKGSVANVLPMLGLYAFSSYRLLPALQNIFEALTQLQVNSSMLENLADSLATSAAPTAPAPASQPLSFKQELRFERLTYSYPATDQAVIKDLSLAIRAGTSVAFVGSTGSGKTTTIDLLLGLLRPAGGVLTVDGVPLTDATLPAWQQKLGYVPQHIHLNDDSVLNNIALGIEPAAIDAAAAEKAARAAGIHDFIVSMPQGYNTDVGERGVRLSGGQRQRLGIARALYHAPEVLILDEATSALDNITEDTVFSAIEAYGRTRTVIMIAHRLSTVRHCDCIFLMEGGQLKASGTYDELLDNKLFAAMARGRADEAGLEPALSETSEAVTDERNKLLESATSDL